MFNKKLAKAIVSIILCLVIIMVLPSSVYGVDSAAGITITTSSHHITIGGSTTMVATTNPTGLYVNWISSNTSIATINSSGVVTGVSAGTVNIVAYCYNPETSSTLTTTVSVTVHDDPIGLNDGVSYYLLNHGYDKVMTTGGASDSNYTNVYASTRDSTTATQWRLEILPDGMAQLISVGSATNKCLTVNGTNLCICTNTQSANQKFIIERSDTEFYEGYYLIRYGDMYVACYADYNVYLVSSVVRRAYWSISKVEKGDADLYTFKYTGFDTTANNTLFATTMTSAGYSPYNGKNDLASDAYEYLCSLDDIFIFRGHGNAGIIEFRSSSGTSTGAISVNSSICSLYGPINGTGVGNDRHYIDSLTNNSLSSLRIVLYIGCSTGKDITKNGVTYNLVDATYQKGAHYVLGTTQTVYTHNSDDFLEAFLNSVNEGNNIQLSIQHAIEATGNNVLLEDENGNSYSGSYPIYSIGDEKQYLD